jgi:FkbM family methyltransferase
MVANPLVGANGLIAEWVLLQFPQDYQGWAVDVGASDGVSVNSTYHLEVSHRWNVLCVEPNPMFHASLKRYRAFVERCACSDHSGPGVLYVNNDNPEAFSSLKLASMKREYPSPDPGRVTAPKPGKIWSKVEVPVKTVNDLLERWQFPQLDALLVDTEDTELDVLKGCDFDRWNPRVVVVESWETPGPCDVFLSEKGFIKATRNASNDVWVKPE